MTSMPPLIIAVLFVLAASGSADEEPELNLNTEKVLYTPPSITGNVYLAETFDKGLAGRWVLSEARKEGTDDDVAKYNGEWKVQEPGDVPVKGDVGLVLTTRARHAAISTKLEKPFTFTGKPLVVQYEVRFQNGMECGGAYVKLISEKPNLDLRALTDKTPYTIMFGPDMCGNEKKLHLIMRHKNPKTGEYEEKHAKKPSGNLDYYSDKKTHLFRLTINPDSTWEIHVDDAMVNSGSLLTDMTPPINPPAEIDDPNDEKPADWDDREKIPDPDASKPIDWDEDAPELIPDEEAVKPEGWLDDEPDLVDDPEAVRPADWDDEMDGEWEAPKVENPKCKGAPGCGEWTRPKTRNPNYKGKWRAPLISNPSYSGVWSPKRIPNPDFFEDTEPYKMTPIVAVAFELWSMTENILFDNILVTDNVKVADDFSATSWNIKRAAELAVSEGAKKSWSQWVADVTEGKPWIWAVVVIGLTVPLALIVYCCCKSPAASVDTAAQAKKTDAVSPDDEVTDSQAEPEKDEKGSGDAPKVGRSPARSGRAALQTQDEAEELETNSEVENASGSQEVDSQEEVEPSKPKKSTRSRAKRAE